MRNCFTKITNVFRKKPIGTDEHGSTSLDGEDFLRQHRQSEGTDDDTEFQTTISYVILNDCTPTKGDYKRPSTLNKCDNNNDDNDDDSKDKSGNCDNNYERVSAIEHREISNGNVLGKQKAIKTSSQGTSVTTKKANDNEKTYSMSKRSQKQSATYQNLLPLQVSTQTATTITSHRLKNVIDKNDSNTNKLLKQTKTTFNLNKRKVSDENRLPKKEQEKYIEPQLEHEQKNNNHTHISLTNKKNNANLLDNNADDEGTYIQEYKSFVENDKSYFINSPLPLSLPREGDLFVTKEILKRPIAKINNEKDMRQLPKVILRQSYPTVIPKTSITTSSAINEVKSFAANTLEQIEYDTKMIDESDDVMTPLPADTLISRKEKHQQAALGRTIQPEIIEVIRNLDEKTLRINNLTPHDKNELLRRFDVKNQHHPPNSHDNNNIRILSNYSNVHLLQQQQYQHLQANTIKSDDSDTDEVVLRRAFIKDRTGKSLYERRQPKCPKLKLNLGKTNSNEVNTTRLDWKFHTNAERNAFEIKYPTVLPPNTNLKALLIFHKADNIYEVMQQACNRQHLEVTLVKSMDSAMESLCSHTEYFHIIIIDTRSAKHLDAEHIARSIRHMSGYHFATIIAVVKKSISERDDVLNALLDAGVNRCIAESTNLSMCTMELKQSLHSIVRPHNVLSTQQSLYTALHRLKEVLIITDDLLRIQYANRSTERLLNMRLDEIINKPLAEIFVSDVSTINQNTGKGVREFDGILTVKRKNQEGIPMHVRVVPVACIGRIPTHFVFNFDVPGGHTDFIATLPQPKEAPRGSLHSIRRGSFDVRSIASDGLRRTSLAKLTSLPLEAPITKIINLLSQVQENCSADEARLIDKVMEFLKREGLYSPQMKEIRPDDPIATDLIGALLTGPNIYSSRRSSNDSIVKAGRTCNSTNTTGIMPAKMKATPLIMEILEESLNWEFNIFKLEEITEKQPLLYLGMEIFRRFDVFSTLGVDETVCKNWLALIESHYHADNTYHNSTHAADVLQATGVFISQLSAKNLVMDRLDEASALIAAVAHDVDHPGRSSAFLCNSNNPLALLYNDLTVLESHHASITFRLALADDKVNIFKNLDTDTYKSARSTIIDMILATEMTRHFEHLAKFVSVFGGDVESRDILQIVQAEEESSILMRRMLIKVADVSNPARPLTCCIEWARRIAEEYFTQTDEEKEKNLPIVMPMFDRATCSIPKSQIGFIEYIIQDMMHAWDSFIDMPELITYMQINYSQWKKFQEQGIHTLAEVKAKQMSLLSNKSVLK